MTIDYLTHLERDTDLLAACASGGLETPVAACPGWDLGDLFVHTGRLHRWVAALVGSGTTDRIDRDTIPIATGGDRTSYLVDGGAELVSVLRSCGQGAPVWTWSKEDRTARFWFRRMAHETSIHRWDGEDAAGGFGSQLPRRPAPIPTDLAVDGIDEALRVFGTHPRLLPEPLTGEGETVHLHCTDADGEWLLRFTPEGLVVEAGHHKGDAAVRGSASDLNLWVWGRDTAGRVEILGDPAAAASWSDRARY